MIFNKLLISIIIIATVSSVAGISNAREIPHRALTASENDLKLRDSLLTGDLAEFRKLLASGANPTEWLENSHYGWVFCAATEKGRESFLHEIINHGYDVDFYRSDVATELTRPLLCAIRFDNLNALEILVEAGADPTVSICENCTRRLTRSVPSEAMLVRKYDLAVWLLDKGRYTEKQLDTIVLLLESTPIFEESPINQERLALGEALRKMGIEVNPWTKANSNNR